MSTILSDTLSFKSRGKPLSRTPLILQKRTPMYGFFLYILWRWVIFVAFVWWRSLYAFPQPITHHGNFRTAPPLP